MLRPETARERLEAQKAADWEARRRRRLDRLHRGASSAATAVLSDLASLWSLRTTDCGPALDALSARGRTKLFSAFLPDLGTHLERLWQEGLKAPYLLDFDRRPFRAPDHPEDTLFARRERFLRIALVLKEFEPDAAWVAHWAPHISWGNDLGALLAAVIAGGGHEADEVFNILVDSAAGDDDIGGMGRHVVVGLLGSPHEEGWSCVERLLLAAQREEGLRQTILEVVDEAQPAAFRRMLGLILEHELTRFSATVRALGVWLGLPETAGDRRRACSLIERLVANLDDPGRRADAITTGEPEDAYLGLWCSAYENAPATVPVAAPLLADDSPERRYAATYLLSQLRLTEALDVLVPVLDDEDLRVASLAFAALAPWVDYQPPDMFERVERLLSRLTKSRTTLDPIVWPWTAATVERGGVAGLLPRILGERPPARLLPYLRSMDADSRAAACAALTGDDEEMRRALLHLVGDASARVREQAFARLRSARVSDAEAIELEGLLSRKAGDLRRGVMTLLLGRGDKAALASAGRLLETGQAAKRLAGLELLRRLSEAGRAKREALRLARAFQARRDTPTNAEATQLDVLLGSASGQTEAYAEMEYLGLGDPGDRTPARRPADHAIDLCTPAALEVLRRLDDLVHEHRDDEITLTGWDGTPHSVLLGDAYGLGLAWPPRAPAGGEEPLPLREVWEAWYESRPLEARDEDGGDLLRAAVVPVATGTVTTVRATSPAALAVLEGHEAPRLRYWRVVQGICGLLWWSRAPEHAPCLVLDAAETHLCRMKRRDLADREPDRRHVWMPPGDESLSAEELEERYGHYIATWRDDGWVSYVDIARALAVARPELWGTDDYARLWALERWIESPGPRVRRKATPLDSFLVACRAGVATDTDVYHQFLDRSDRRTRAHTLSLVSGRQPHPLVAGNERFAGLVQAIRARVLEVELARGDMPTPASRAALQLRCTGPAATLARGLRALGSARFVRGWTYDEEARTTVLSHIVRATYPAETDTPEAFADAVRPLGLKETRLVELAAFVPQWARHVEALLEWEGLAEGIWWMHAHTKDQAWTVAQELRDAWAAEVAERTPLSAAELVDGAVDVAWFERVHARLGSDRWAIVDRAARYCSTAGGHKRAQLFAAAMLGQVDEAELRRRISDKRHQDSVRSIGLMPLPAEGDRRDDAVRDRYLLLQGFLRESRQFGSQRQASERRAVEIGLHNLARTAGYRNPLRLGWSMEARAAADVVDAMTVTVGETSAGLELDETGRPQVTLRRGDRVLKAVPRELRGSGELKALRARATELRRQSSRARASLEQAMVGGEPLTGDELEELSRHPLLAPHLNRLVLVTDEFAGYMTRDGRVLVDHGGVRQALGRQETVRIAHPLDLLKRGDWDLWQKDCMRRGVVQPFKQVFRELYVPTSAELEDRAVSRRYAGHQLQPGKALVLLGRRGWVTHPDEGVRRTFHDADLTVTLGFLDGWGTPIEVEAPTLEEVRFVRRGTWTAVPVEDVPPILFSEVMRDLDLVVSVAHIGGVDPEATASTTEMRASLIAGTCELLDIANVRVEGRWALVDGQLGEYSVHLGSGVVHRRPGGSICIVPVHGQHRGRVFLPFADDDPKTAEVLAKVLLLARDDEIKDPTILEQLRG